MLNHIRTLLRNTAPEPVVGLPGQEIIDPSFRPVDLPPHLAAIRAVLFGSQPDQAGLDLKLRQYMAVLHSTGLEQYVRQPDPRITYEAPVLDTIEFDFSPQVLPAADDLLFLAGTPPVESNGALLHLWYVTVVVD